MSDPDDELRSVEEAVAELIPALTERLLEHSLGEIEVRRGALRVRVAAAGTPGATADARRTVPAVAEPEAAQAAEPAHVGGVHQAHQRPDPHGVTSPAVGYFAYIDGLGPGLEVQKGDPLGYVDVLGVRHDVRAPRSGVVRSLVTEGGEAVEYGQLLMELEGAAS
jgi:biotin carboxyl carrier protein